MLSLTDRKYINILFAANYVALISSYNQLISDPPDEMDSMHDETDIGALSSLLIFREHFHHFDIYVVNFVDNQYFPLLIKEKLPEIMACNFKYNLLQIG